MVATVTTLNTAGLSARLLELFRDVPVDLITHHGRMMRLVDVDEGTVLAGPEARTDSVWGVLEGRVERCRPETATPLHSAGPGDTVGLTSLLARSAPSDQLVAATDCRLLEIPGELIQSLADSSHRFSTNLLEALAEPGQVSDRQVEEEACETDRRWAERRFSRSMRRCELTGFFVSLIVIRPDGAAIGEEGVVAGLDHMVRDQLRPYDLTAPVDGSLVVLCIETRARDAARIAERIRVTLSHGIGAGFSVSCGVVEMMDGESAANLIAAGEAAAEEAAEGGGDRVVWRERT